MSTTLLSGVALATMAAMMAAAPPPPENPLLRPWTGPYGGVPPFDQVEGRALPAGARRGDG